MTTNQYEPDHTGLELQAWDGSEIYENEEYLQFDSGDLVLNTRESVLWYLGEKYEFTKSLIEDYSIIKTLGEEQR